MENFALSSDNTKEIIGALIKAQKSMANPSKNAKNDHFKNKYADLANVLNSCLDILNENGIYVFQPTVPGENGVLYLITKLQHVTGEWIQSVIPINIKWFEESKVRINILHQVGGAITYYRRYALLSLLGLSAEDNDGNEGFVDPKNEVQSKTSTQKEVKSALTEEQIDWAIEEFIKQHNLKGQNHKDIREYILGYAAYHKKTIIQALTALSDDTEIFMKSYNKWKQQQADKKAAAA